MTIDTHRTEGRVTTTKWKQTFPCIFFSTVFAISLFVAARVMVTLFWIEGTSVVVPDMVHFSCHELKLFDSLIAEVGLGLVDEYSEEDLLLYSATRQLCLMDSGPDLLNVRVARGFEQNYLTIFGYLNRNVTTTSESFITAKNSSGDAVMRARRMHSTEPMWVDEAYVNYFSDVKQKKHYNRTALLVQSVHEFSTRPILVFYVADKIFSNDERRKQVTSLGEDQISMSVDETGRYSYVSPSDNWVPLLDPNIFPRLVVFQIHSMDYAGVSARIGFNMNKLRSMLLSRCRVCVELDSDSIIYNTADDLFDQTAKIAATSNALASAPVSPSHWMTRDPESDDYREEENWIFTNYNGTRTMSWIHAHPTWTYRALPFISALYTGIVSESPDIDKLLRTDLASDERALNIYYWASGFSAQWCKFDLFPAAFKHAADQDLDSMYACCHWSDSKWHPNGQPIVFHSIHGIQNDDDAREMLRLFRGYKHRTMPKVYWNGKFYYDFETVPVDGRRCLM
eukprot:Lankesteria_metandrocarpae@DN4466_c0_g1_i1.p1